MSIHSTPNQEFYSEILIFFKVAIVKITHILSILNAHLFPCVKLTICVKFPLDILPKILYYKNGSDFLLSF